MEGAAAYLVSALIIVVILVLSAYLWRHYYGWKPFVFTSNSTNGLVDPAWVPTDTGDISRLRFENVRFTVTLPNGQYQYLEDVSPILDNMALAYKSAGLNPKAVPALKLREPLNSFSFPIQGYNVPFPDDTSHMCTAKSCAGSVELAGYYKEV